MCACVRECARIIYDAARPAGGLENKNYSPGQLRFIYRGSDCSSDRARGDVVYTPAVSTLKNPNALNKHAHFIG